MTGSLRNVFSLFSGTLRDLAPILIVVAFFQFLVLRQPIDNFTEILIGFAFVLLGLTLFIRGLEMALFPIGEALANAFARKGSLFWLLLFAFGLGFGTTVAEPAPADPGTLPTGSERILLVDDEPALVNIVRIQLERLGYTVRGTNDPLEALDRFEQFPDAVDLVIQSPSDPAKRQ